MSQPGQVGIETKKGNGESRRGRNSRGASEQMVVPIAAEDVENYEMICAVIEAGFKENSEGFIIMKSPLADNQPQFFRDVSSSFSSLQERTFMHIFDKLQVLLGALENCHYVRGTSTVPSVNGKCTNAGIPYNNKKQIPIDASIQVKDSTKCGCKGGFRFVRKTGVLTKGQPHSAECVSSNTKNGASKDGPVSLDHAVYSSACLSNYTPI